MRINIYYGGRGVIEDPTLFVINTITRVFEELRVKVDRYNLYEEKNSISAMPKTLKDADGIILAVHVEWMGIGGLMQQFLDSCWLYGDKEAMGRIYMMPVVMSSTYGERDAENTLVKSWELLGGIPLDGLCAYVENTTAFETNTAALKKIEKKTEEMYRAISQKNIAFPNSSVEICKKVLKTKAPKLTPQESEQLSEYISDDNYVKKQKEDIEELASIFKGLLGEQDNSSDNIIATFHNAFDSSVECSASYIIRLEDIEKDLYININCGMLECKYGINNKADVYIRTDFPILQDIFLGKKNFQGAFMSGKITAKGNFNTLRMLDNVFNFKRS
ncbi:MAG: SCP2 sterol-binding domain-containing protein [Lachnospiraceae bacterium]|nr:SCP2 sterol-binding domain-containing protein [Lachnospiraceae bacterium]